MIKRELVFKVVNGESISSEYFVVFQEIEFYPLHYSEVAVMILNDEIIIPLNGRGKVAQTNNPKLSVGEFMSFTSTLESSYTCSAIDLVRGGCLPFGLALRDNAMIFPD